MGDLIDIHGGGGAGSDTDADAHQDGLDIEDDEVLGHPLVQAFRDPSTSTVERLRLIQVAMLRAHAELEFQRLNPEAFEQPEAGRAVSRRVRMLRRLAEVELAELRVCGPRTSEADHPLVPQLLDHLFKRVVEVIREALPEDMADGVEAGLRRGLTEDERIPWPSPEVE